MTMLERMRKRIEKWRALDAQRIAVNADINYRLSRGETVTFNQPAQEKTDLLIAADELESELPAIEQELTQQGHISTGKTWAEFVVTHNHFSGDEMHGAQVAWFEQSAALAAREAEITDLRSPGPCGKHPKMFWHPSTDITIKDGHYTGNSHCSICGELTTAKRLERAAALRAVQELAKRFIAERGQHGGAHEFCCEQGSCRKCDESYVRAESWFDAAILALMPPEDANALEGHDVEVVEAAFRLAVRELSSEFSAGVPEFTKAVADKVNAAVLTESEAIHEEYRDSQELSEFIARLNDRIVANRAALESQSKLPGHHPYNDAVLDAERAMMRSMYNDLENCLNDGKDPVLLLVVWRDAINGAGAQSKPGQNIRDDYIAWCRYDSQRGQTVIRLCDSDAKGAFKVYRAKPGQAGEEKV
jgi:hypothetical protein